MPPPRSHGQLHYTGLLVICLLQLAMFTLPAPWNRLSSLGYLLLGIQMLRALGGFTSRHSGVSRHPIGRMAYRLIGLSALSMGSVWMLTPISLRSSGVPVVVLWAVFAIWSAARLITQLADESSVNRVVLRGALAGYLMLGLAAGLVCTGLETAQPTSFLGLREQAVLADGLQPVWQLNFVSLNYFAFVTLTTTGFGDIQPATPPAQMVSIVIAVVGNVYLVSVLGLLIGRFSSNLTDRS